MPRNPKPVPFFGSLLNVTYANPSNQTIEIRGWRFEGLPARKLGSSSFGRIHSNSQAENEASSSRDEGILLFRIQSLSSSGLWASLPAFSLPLVSREWRNGVQL